ncbi:MAG: Rieske (2Fe-2S) protein [Deltaproteobacteria bacterium]|nr:Rieske (2Fe-2S) protein [Deltaproteobacteria bacterium]
MKRRQFLKTGGVVAVCACTGSTLSACKMLSGISDTPVAPLASYRASATDVVVDLAKVPTLKTVGGSVKIEINDKKYNPLKLLVVRVGDREYKAFLDKCTHGEREMEYAADKKTLTCVSFGHSRFDDGGKVLDGPAEKPLRLFPVKVANDEIIISV